MEPFDKDEIPDRELDELLPEWQAPAAPAHLRAAVFPERRGAWWRRLWSASIRVPLPAAACLVVATAGALWREAARTPRVVIQTRTVEVPVVKEREVTVYRGMESPRPKTTQTAPPRLLPVAELRPRIVRGTDEQY